MADQEFHQRPYIIKAVEDKTHVAGQRAITTAIHLRGFFEYADTRLLVDRRVGRRTRRVTGADNQHVIVKFLVCHDALLVNIYC